MNQKLTFFSRAFLAGIMIGIGDVINAMCENRVVGALLFGLGLLCILHNGFYLYTGKIGIVWIAPDKKKETRNLFVGILCNILVCAAVLMAICAKDISGKLLVSFFVIMLFVTAGFEHCVANMYYITAGLFCKMNPDYVNKAMELYGYTEAQLSQLSWGSFLIKNLIPVTLGNIVGGICCIGLPLLYLNREKK